MAFYKQTPDGLELLDRIVATDGQLVFDGAWPDDGEATYHAFVETDLLPIVGLELKKVAAPQCQVDPSGVRVIAEVEGSQELYEQRDGPGAPLAVDAAEALGSSMLVEAQDGQVSVTAVGHGGDDDDASSIWGTARSFVPLEIFPVQTSTAGSAFTARVRFEVTGAATSGDHHADYGDVEFNVCYDLSCVDRDTVDGEAVSGVFVVDAEVIVLPGRERFLSIFAEATVRRVAQAMVTARYVGIDGVFDEAGNPVEYTACTIDGL